MVPSMSRFPHRDDPAWEQALDWLMRIQAAPEDETLRQACAHWVSESEAHSKAYRKAEKVWCLTGAIPAAFPARPASRTAQSPSPTRGRRHALMGVAAALAACLVLVFGPDLNRRWGADFHTGTGETRPISLADGSAIDLDAESAIDVSLSADRRAVSLRTGRAFFRVAADPTRPFVVSAGKTTVTVTGTAFDVASIGQDIVVEVQSGSVLVTVAGVGQEVNIALKPGERVRLSGPDGRLTEDAVPPAQVGLWRSGRLVVNGATLAQVVEALRPRYHGLILIKDETLANRQVTGVFDLNDPVAALEAALQPHGGVVSQPIPHVMVVSTR